nr:toprim domain-containing protein [uncultured Mitsuokella sp.]
MNRRKVILIIVEGPSDAEALEVLLRRFFDQHNGREVYVAVVHGDITTRDTSGNIVSKVGDFIKQQAARNFLKQSDYLQVIHLTDTDGCFIDNEDVLFDESAKAWLYSETNIISSRPQAVCERNRLKSANIKRLVATKQIWKIPYKMFYMSCNLDHVLYGKLNRTDEEKERDARAFAARYVNQLDEFVKFMTQSAFSVCSDYKASWAFIEELRHSLERHSNLGLVFRRLDE